METKTNPIEACEIKAKGSGWSFEGYASKFGGVDSYNDTIEKGAYQKTLSERQWPVSMRFEHRTGMIPPGKWTTLAEDNTGLFVEGELTKGMRLADDIKAAMNHGTMSGLSIGYRIPKGGAEEKEGIRYLKEIDLVEVSIVQNPADTGAVITGMKAEIESLESLKEFEYFLRDVGDFSTAAAKCYISRLKSFLERDAMKERDKEIAHLKSRLSSQATSAKVADIIKGLKI